MSLARLPEIREQTELIKRTVAKGCTDLELELFVRQCERTGLDPFARQIYAIKRYDAALKQEVMQTQVSIDGLRTLAANTDELGGQEGPYWCGKNGVWNDVWIESGAPFAAKVTVIRTKTHDARFTGVALYSSYAQRKKDGNPTRMWEQMAPEMLAKCAEALALRKAFPQRLSGLYSTEEMGQASNPALDQHQSNETPPQASQSRSKVPDGESPVLPPPLALRSDSGALEPKPAPMTDRVGPMRVIVARAIGTLSGEGRSKVLAEADAKNVAMPDEKGFTFEHANALLEMISAEREANA